MNGRRARRPATWCPALAAGVLATLLGFEGGASHHDIAAAVSGAPLDKVTLYRVLGGGWNESGA